MVRIRAPDASNGLDLGVSTAHHFLGHFIDEASFRWWIHMPSTGWEAKKWVFAEFTFCLVFQTYFIYIKYTFMKLNMNILMSCSCVSLLQTKRLHHLSPNSLPAPLWAQVPWGTSQLSLLTSHPGSSSPRGSSDITGVAPHFRVRPAEFDSTLFCFPALWPWTVCLAFVGFSP